MAIVRGRSAAHLSREVLLSQCERMESRVSNATCLLTCIGTWEEHWHVCMRGAWAVVLLVALHRRRGAHLAWVQRVWRGGQAPSC